MLDYSSYGVGCLGRTCSITHLLQFSYCRVDSSAWELLMMSFFQRKQLNVLKAAAFFADFFSISFTVKAVLLTKNWIVSWMTESKEVFFFCGNCFGNMSRKFHAQTDCDANRNLPEMCFATCCHLAAVPLDAFILNLLKLFYWKTCLLQVSIFL